MDSTVAQIFALTCYANAAICGSVKRFFPDNSTCQFCNAITFVVPKNSLLGKREKVVAASPDEWFSRMCSSSALGVRLDLARNLNPKISDRMTAGFVGGGGLWNMQVLRSDAMTEMWVARWELSDHNAPNRKNWRVTYVRVGSFKDSGKPAPDLDTSTARLRGALQQILAFAERYDYCSSFAERFRRAGDCLDDRRNCAPYHCDLYVENTMPPLAETVLLAAQNAWVFGAMGSWNDMGFEGADQAEYDRVSSALFETLSTAIIDAVNCSLPSSCWTSQMPRN